MSSIQLWNGIDTPIHQSTNLFSQKFKESEEFNCNGFQPMCPHHPQKKAKYLLLNDTGPNEKLCTKCAVQLAQQGHKIENIEEDNVKKKQTDSFIEQLLQTKSEIDNVHSNLLSTEANLKKFYNDQYTQVVKTFGGIEKQLQMCKSQLLCALSQSLWSGVQMTNQLKVQSKQIEHQLATYISDIRNHYDKIVQMGTLPFNQIMGGQFLKDIQDNKVAYLHYEGKISSLDSFLKEISKLTEKDYQNKKRNHESTRSSSEQKTSKSTEKEKRHQSQPNSKEVKSFDNSEKKTAQTFKITEESIEEWMENSNSKQRRTEPAEQLQSPNILATKFFKKQLHPSRASMKQETNQAMLDKLISEFSQIKQERAMKKQSRTPELGKSVKESFPNKLSPKFLYKNYYK
ncbi:unnamed protein product (macronuclear) [Paramecium tetraurelia]|uniref:Uncharacterized protein n=1 Tax=Paramecium tetraurelia TaxID=5888 RepID=A0DFR9_PARTE|nr:uncharacterized protein GSPATT00016699001 [Paramecium tetraurelia]CAK81886.1 unnamed protein product [Paramecium tetraurelia]|eukprot:XP_001449283.1 hypothetical protein (macronuclear) [Paramecium tetraurelia strain d4-2]